MRGTGETKADGLWFRIEERNVSSGSQSQHLTFTGGDGEIGLENQSLNRWGMHFVRGNQAL